MPGRMDYCEYYLYKFADMAVPFLIQKTYKTKDDIRDAYESSSCYLRNLDARNRYLVDTLTSFIEQDSEKFGRLDADANRILKRAINRISNAGTYADIFGAASDYLWVEASSRLSDSRGTGKPISLTDNEILENRRVTAWIAEIKEKIDNAKYDLSCMEEAENLPIGKKIFLGLVENPDVAWYANAENISYSEKKQRMSDCRVYIKELEAVYFAFLVTNIHCEELRRRYR